ncbi:protein of unknown function [Methylacidimicrobium sp. AP8]|uniref:hypothetical protein n=1 Tax=Methylacidimicrobium sp. AP8 TaxID=2730359 RepID=UPI0018C0C78F|nr:hypothetical protein [Methylacidimicrobium sp. AP8]CAB4243511.1 protein of unknown function [Methylacidimicrobium sp. AP8]
MAGKPYRSKLEAHWDTIRELRQRRKSWREITDILRGRGVSVSQHALYNFVQVRRKWAREGKFSELPHPSLIGKGIALGARAGAEAETMGKIEPERKTAAKRPQAEAARIPEEQPGEWPTESMEMSVEDAIAAAKAAAKGRAAHQKTDASSVAPIQRLTFLPSRGEQKSEENQPKTQKGRRRGPVSGKSSAA